MPDERKDRPAAQSTHPWSVRIATVAGIEIRLHATFFLGLLYFGQDGRGGVSLGRIALALALFACVALHELGHSLVALRYSIPVRDITLYPIGGIATIEKRPEPKQEFWIALAGPAVNVVIAVILWALLGFAAPSALVSMAPRHPFMIPLLGLNVWIVLFNMIPAFPMDGGRVLRSVLAMNIRPERATAIAARIGQFLAIGFAILAFTKVGSPMLLLIAFFIFIGAGQEATASTQATMLEGVRASQAMMTDVRTLSVGTTLKEATDALLSTSQQEFPVLHGDVVQGLLTRNGLLRALSLEGPMGYVAGAMDRQFASVGPDDALAEALSHMRDTQTPVLVIDPTQNGKLLGVINGENVAEFFAVRQIAATRGAAP